MIADAQCHCPVCSGPDDGRHADATFRNIAGDIASVGWTSMGIGSAHGMPGWAFTVGLWHSHRSPEVAMFGLRVPDMQHWINDLADQAKAGDVLRPDEERTGVLPGFPVALRKVHPSWYRELFGTALGFYGKPPLPFVQAVWPDREGVFPWEEGCGERCRGDQPWLWLPRDEHPPSVWRFVDVANDWPFPDQGINTAVITTKRILNGEQPVCGVVRDEEGGWQVLEGGPVDVDECVLVSLLSILAKRPELARFADLPVATEAWLLPDGTWERVPYSED